VGGMTAKKSFHGTEIAWPNHITGLSFADWGGAEWSGVEWSDMLRL
jgi:hypothetical protein